MAADNVFGEGVSYLEEAKDTVVRLTDLKEELEESKNSQKKIKRLISQEEKSINDEIESTLKKRRNQISNSYDKQIDANSSKIKQVQNKKSHKKNQRMEKRIENETVEIREDSRQLNIEIKTLYKQNKVPAFCNSTLYYSLFSPKGLGEILRLFIVVLIMCIAVPFVISFRLYNSSLEGKKALCVFIAALIVIAELVVYFIVFNLTKVRHRDTIAEGRKVRDKIRANDKAIKAIKNSIAKDKDESMYNLEKYDRKIKQLEQEGDDISDSKKEALNEFEKNTQQIIVDEINNRRKDKLEELKGELKKEEATSASLEKQISETELTLTNQYETYLGKDFCTEEKLADLIAIMEEGMAGTVSEAIKVYKGDDK